MKNDITLLWKVYLALHKKMKFSIKVFFGKWDLVTFTEENLNGKLQFVCSIDYYEELHQQIMMITIALIASIHTQIISFFLSQLWLVFSTMVFESNFMFVTKKAFVWCCVSCSEKCQNHRKTTIMESWF